MVKRRSALKGSELLIKPSRVEKIFEACLEKDEHAKLTLRVNGITMLNVLFSREQLRKHEKEIRGLFDKLSNIFRRPEGGCFDDICFCKNQKVWTGWESRMEKFVLLGVALETIKFVEPRQSWEIFPTEKPFWATAA